GDEAAAGALAARELLPLAAVLDEASGADASMAVTRRLAIADAYRLAGRPREALAIYDELDRAHPDRAEILLGRAECLVAMDDGLRDAMLIYRRLGASGPGAGASYWLAQLRMLELIERSGRNREQILPRLARLRAESPELGGPRFRARFEALRRRQESAP
ncbi:MAG: tetratricopeptide repeat protein, partial [Phycisphaerales bacterium]|nr:tetratricopeptide repeat protein [Phycisphaerales bacterium]